MKRFIYILCFILFLILFLSATSLAKKYRVFDVVGDSISAGMNPDYQTNYGWVHMLFGEGGGIYPAPKTETIYTLWPGITAYNSGISGSMASEWAITKPAYLTGVLNHHPDLVVVYIGANDFLAYSALGPITDTELEIYRTNLTIIIYALQLNTPKPDIILVNYYDLFDGYSENLPDIPLVHQYLSLSTTAIRADQVIQEVAQDKGCYLVGNIYSDFMHHCYGADVLISNGDTHHISPNYVKTPIIPNFNIHPNTIGHSKIYDNIYAQLLILKNITSVDYWMLYN